MMIAARVCIRVLVPAAMLVAMVATRRHEPRRSPMHAVAAQVVPRVEPTCDPWARPCGPIAIVDTRLCGGDAVDLCDDGFRLDDRLLTARQGAIEGIVERADRVTREAKAMTYRQARVVSDLDGATRETRALIMRDPRAGEQIVLARDGAKAFLADLFGVGADTSIRRSR